MDDPRIHRWLEEAHRHLSEGRADAAIEVLRQLLTLDPDLAEAHALLAICLYGKRRLAAAEREAGIALGLAPDLPWAHHAMGLSLLAQRRFADAERHLEEASLHDPDEPAHLRALAGLYGLTDRKKDVLPLLERALDLEPDDPDTLVALGNVHLEEGRVELAAQRAREALEVTPEHLDGLVLMGHMHLRRGAVDEAREHAIWALRQDPEDLGALHLLAAVKARASFFLGLWWRYSVWMEALGERRSMAVLLGAFVVYKLAALLTDDLGAPELSSVISLAWLGVVAYTWVGPAMFKRSLEKELSTVRLHPDF